MFLTRGLRRTLLLTVALSSSAGLLVAPLLLGPRQARKLPAAAAEAPPRPADAGETYGNIPLSFEANRGQTDASVDFLARGSGYTLFLKPAEAVLVLARARRAEPAKRSERGREGVDASLGSGAEGLSARAAAEPAVLRMSLDGADASVAAEGAEELTGRVNYLVGDDPSRWRLGVPAYGRVRYAGVYPGVDLVYYGNQRQLEYDFHVSPGADPRRVRMRFEGAESVEVDEGGDLLLTVDGGLIRQPKPFIYQEVAGARRAVEGGYVVGEGGRVGFALGRYDESLPLVIDPVLVYSTYLGGSAGDQGLAVAVDSAGSAYIAGFTNSTNFPTANALQGANAGGSDAFVAKLNAAGTALVYSTYLGGSGTEQARGLAVDSAGNAYVTGFTSSTNFPTANAVQATKGATNEDAFLTKLNAAGTALVYSTYHGGGSSSEFGQAVAVDSAGNAYVTGNTFSTDFPTVNPIQAAKGGGSTDAFLTKFNSAGSARLYSTYLGGSGNDGGFGIAVDSAGSAYVTGETESTNFPTANAVQAANGGGRDAFVTKVNAAGSALVYSTYLGGGGDVDVGQAIAVDAAGNAYVAGQTNSTNFPTANAFQSANGGSSVLQDAFLTKFNAAGTALVYSTYFGGAGGEIAFGVGLDSAGNVYIAGATASVNTFPTANALQCVRAGGSDAFVTKFNPSATALFYSTYLGGAANDEARGLAVDAAGNAYLGGFTRSSNFPVANAIQSAFGGDAVFGDAFVTKVGDTSASAASQFRFSQSVYTVDEDVTSVQVVVQRTGDVSGAATVEYATTDGTASERSDYTTALGTLRFAAGQIDATVNLLISEDSFTEGAESFTVTLSNPTGGATLACLTPTASVQINDDATEPAANPIDDPTVFTGQHYHDFLNRQADAPGLAFWANQIIACGGDAACVDRTRTHVSTAFFLSIEFQQTGFLVYRFYKATFTDSAARPRGMPRYREFLRDTQEIGRGVVVNQGNWQQQLEANRQEFARRWVQRPEFLAQFPESMSAGAFVDKLFQNSEVTPTQAERDAAITAYGAGGVEGRAAALRSVADSGSVYNRQFNSAFVLSQYIGYLRRNPNDPPEPGLNYAGFDFWLAKLNSFSLPGEDVRDPQTAQRRVHRAEMVRAFLLSSEYRGRFGQP